MKARRVYALSAPLSFNRINVPAINSFKLKHMPVKAMTRCCGNMMTGQENAFRRTINTPLSCLREVSGVPESPFRLT